MNLMNILSVNLNFLMYKKEWKHNSESYCKIKYENLYVIYCSCLHIGFSWGASKSPPGPCVPFQEIVI